MDRDEELISARLRTPRAAAVAGILFSLLLVAALVLVRISVPRDPADAGAWLTDPTRRSTVSIALNLVPFAGIAFLWFIGVVRDRIGRHEDRFFATVFLGSGVLFVALLFAASAVAGGLLADPSFDAGRFPPQGTWETQQRITFILMNTYAFRMGAVFIVSTATIGLRTEIIPRWIGIAGYVVAFALLFVVGITPWLSLLLPTWILVLSVHILVGSLGAEGRAGEPGRGDR